MKKISYAVYNNSILNCCPGAHIERRDGKDVAVVPLWDAEHDVASERVYELVEDSDEPKFKAGDVLRGPTGDTFTIVDPMAAMMSLRKGAEFKP